MRRIHTITRIRMIIRRHIQGVFRVHVRLGCNIPEAYVDFSDCTLDFFRKKLPYREEVYPSLSTYWKIRLL